MISASGQHAPIFTRNAAVARRQRRAAQAGAGFFLSTAFGLVVLLALLFTVINQAVGLVAVINKVRPSEISSIPLDQLTHNQLAALLTDHLTQARVNAIEREKPLSIRSRQDLLSLVESRIIQPQIQKSWTLAESLFHRQAVLDEMQSYPGASLEWRSWVSARFILGSMTSQPETAGLRTALLGSLFMIAITILFAFPVGVGAAIYLEEFAPTSRISRIIQINIDNLAGVPSIVYGILGLAIFVRSLGAFTSGSLFGIAAENGRTILSAGLTLGLLILPTLIITSQEAVRSVPGTVRMASYGLGATRWQTIWHHVLPGAMPGILTGGILAVSRAIGETAPLIVVGASTFINSDPTSLFSHFTALPIQIYNWTSRPQDEYRFLAAAAILVLLAALLSINAAAIFLRQKFNQRV